MSYRIKEIYFTQQGEGSNTGRDFVFVRFSGCNLWSGKEKNRKSAICQFCDTDFYGTDGINGGVYSAKQLIEKIKSLWVSRDDNIAVVLTGGEPLLQVNDELVAALKQEQIYIAVETNGTLDAPDHIDWICMSPKANTEIKLKKGNEIKVIFPQESLDPEKFSLFDFSEFYLQPMDSNKYQENLNATITYCQKNPKWKLSLQTHKILGIR
ncbi:MAG: 7-carboxy-7-deazaguanine synthase [Gammaproteobacteria bacterium]|jgi:7-carboxy-7-deazaguanine synthase|nr:MAG: 7-carboxy-7-deazaguanine synthase [Gammaproteobacteria bacterium]|tara:strand:- start:527 stop:1156 length:630 start_codon:yes stop_codon:yes gene_type:complete